MEWEVAPTMRNIGRSEYGRRISLIVSGVIVVLVLVALGVEQRRIVASARCR